MEKLKWWQWVLIVAFGVVAIDLTVRGVPKDTKPQTPPSNMFAPANAKFTAISGNHIWAMVFDVRADPNTLPALARARCKYLEKCFIYGWTDPNLAAGSVPLLKHEFAALAFSSEVDRYRDLELAKWNCAKWKKSDPDECLP